MKKGRKLTATVLAVLAVSATTAGALATSADFGAAAVDETGTYALSEMLTYAIQDEYLAHAEYEEIIDTFGAARPFTNIVRAEETHIAALEPLFEQYGVSLPENTAGEYVAVPDTLIEAYQTGVDAEVENIAMYETFLEQDLPDDVRAVFTALEEASQNHLAAFERNADRLAGQGAGSYGGQGRQTRGR
ncbi:MAG TPA: DUF2202 domain-containing protein [Oscillospiraceae bacterium]|nr:DUF2202 domain-containing protein [Oscillospiraceae bacterium]